jgi:hypothetical protein
VGWPTDTGLYRHRSAKEMAKDAAEYIHPDRLARMNARSNGSTVNRLRAQFRVCQQKGDGSRLASFKEAYAASIAEVVAGTAEGPFTFEQFGIFDDRFGVGGWRGSPRHAVWQGDLAHVGDLDHGKWRPVDDATRSKINPSFRPIEKVSFPRPDYLATMARVLYAGSVLGHLPGGFRQPRGLGGAVCPRTGQPQTYPIHFARFCARVSLDATWTASSAACFFTGH